MGVRRVLARAPGRVNLIGEHTDHQEGLVLPAALEQGVEVEAERRTGSAVSLLSEALEETAGFDLAGDPPERGGWACRAETLLRMLRLEGIDVPGFVGRVGGDLPIGAGLASSAAFLVATGLAALELAGAGDYPRAALARLCRHAEERASGVRCGIMDPFASLFGAEGTALRLDCRTAELRAIPFPSETLSLLLVDSGTTHDLADGRYNLRREECEEAARRIRDSGRELRTLRDLPPGELAGLARVLPGTLLRRARHVVGENERVERAARALESGDGEAFGRLLAASHASLRDDFEVSTPLLDSIVSMAADVPGVLGARLVGGGFGGSVLLAVRRGSAGLAQVAFLRDSRARVGRTTPVRRVRIAGGATVRALP